MHASQKTQKEVREKERVPVGRERETEREKTKREKLH